MAIPGDELGQGTQEKGKAVFLLHAWKDHLWDLGSRGDAPEAIPFDPTPGKAPAPNSDEVPKDEPPRKETDVAPAEQLESLTIEPTRAPVATGPSYNAQEISSLLHMSLLQAIASTIPSSAFPIPATTFYTNYILPSRPAFPALIVPHSGSTPPDASPCPSASEITI
ncbi:hypothetical protein C0992_013254, partial [Termitomyces sp. T32_za158]